MGSRKWLWAAIGFQFGMGYSVAYIVNQAGTLITTGSFGAGVIPVLAVALFAGILAYLMHRKEQGAAVGVRRQCDMWQNIIVFLVIGAIVAGAVAKIINDKRKGVKCPGCPYSKECSGSSICSPQTGFDAGQTGFDAGQTGFDAGQTGFDTDENR